MNQEITITNKSKVDALINLFKQGKYSEFIDRARPIFAQLRNNPYALAYLGFSILRVYKNAPNKEIYDLINEAIKLKPEEPEFYNLLGVFARERTPPNQAISLFEHALKLKPDYYEAMYNLAVTYFELAEVEKSIDLLFKAIKYECRLKYLEDLNHYIYYDPRYSNQEYYKLATLFNDIYKKQFNIQRYTHDNSRLDPKKSKLCIGIFNAELNTSPTWDFFEKILRNINKDLFEFNFYIRPSEVHRERECIEYLKTHSKKWIYLNEKSIKETAEIIYKDQVDILIDISGYMPSNYGFHEEEINIGLMTYKAAPVQISWYGFWGTTGIEEVDYLITADESVTESQEIFFSEKIYRMQKGYTHIEIFDDLPEISELPYTKNGFITFGTLNRATKFSSRSYDIWCKILNEVPNSKIYIKFFADPKDYTEKNIIKAFTDRNINLDRVIFNKITKRQDPSEFIESYNEIDIALDTVPFCGVTTAINAISMGVPVIAPIDDNSIVCGGVASLVKALGLNELIVNTDDEYVELAVNLAKDIDKLKYFRTNLRSIAQNSSLNIQNYCKSLEEAFRFIWEDCCKNK